MTIITFNPVSGGSSETHVFTNVKSCSDTEIILYSGERFRKRLCAKVRILSMIDYTTFEELGELFTISGIGKETYIPMTKQEFEQMEELTHI